MSYLTKPRLFLLFFFSLFLLGITEISAACTRIVITDKQQGVMVGRTMDWSDKNMNTHLLVYPQGQVRKGGENGLTLDWIAKYGSIVATAYEDYTTDGMNEKGLAAHILWLDESDYGVRDEKLPGLSVMLWTQFYLDNFATVAEAVRFTETTAFQLLPFYHEGVKKWIKLHLALEDSKGDSAIIEYIDGKPHIYHHPSYTVLTNSPTYDKHLKSISDQPLPGTTDSDHRFARATFYSTRMPSAKSTRMQIAYMQSVINNVAQPYGVKTPERHDVSPTLWRVITDLTNGVYYFYSSTSLNMIYTSLKKFNLRPGSPVMRLDLVKYPDLAGEVTTAFQPI